MVLWIWHERRLNEEVFFVVLACGITMERE